MAYWILWITLIVPWFVLFFLDQKRLRRFLSVAFFTIVLASIWWQVGEIRMWWKIEHHLPFLTNISAFNYGLMPVATILVFYFTYPKAWLFFGTNLLMDAFQAFVISPYVFEKFGLYQMVNMSNFQLLLLQLSYTPIIYLYQRWYDKGKLN